MYDSYLPPNSYPNSASCRNYYQKPNPCTRRSSGASSKHSATKVCQLSSGIGSGGGGGLGGRLGGKEEEEDLAEDSAEEAMA